MEYDAQGYLPEAMINYLARLGWSHGDDELFSREQLVDWFDARNLSKSAAQWDPKKLNWVNAHHIKHSDDADLAARVAPRVAKLGGDPEGTDLPAVMALLKDRAETLNQLAEGAMLFCAAPGQVDADLAAQHMTPEALAILRDFADHARALPDWNVESLARLIQETLARHEIKMPKLGIPLRLAVTGRKQTPAIDAVLAILGRETVLRRLDSTQGG